MNQLLSHTAVPVEEDVTDITGRRVVTGLYTEEFHRTTSQRSTFQRQQPRLFGPVLGGKVQCEFNEGGMVIILFDTPTCLTTCGLYYPKTLPTGLQSGRL